jgi:putative methyltransferase (TIGR04325 family)
MKIESIVYERRSTYEAAQAEAAEGYKNTILLSDLPNEPHDRGSTSIIDVPIFVGHAIGAIAVVASLLGKSHLKVLDVGGALGGHYAFARTTFADQLTFDWTVLETSLYARYGRSTITTPALRFVENPNDLVGEEFDLAYFSASLPYVPSLERVLSSEPVSRAQFIFISRTGLHDEEIPFLQTVTYDVGIVRYPGRIIARNRLFGHLERTHELYTSWQNEQHSVENRAYPAPSMLWRRTAGRSGLPQTSVWSRLKGWVRGGTA